MPLRSLDKIFKPKRIALIGVSNNPDSVASIALKNLVGGGFQGVVYPINPKYEAVMGITCYPDIKSVPKTPDLAVIATASTRVPQLIRCWVSSSCRLVLRNREKKAGSWRSR